LRKALTDAYPVIETFHLTDYKVRFLAPSGRAGADAGTGAVTRVMIESTDDSGQRWSTVGLSANVIDASYNALHDSITYKLFHDAA
ncbi:MAG: citramalate synthase, partial [Proteobacteria bacterium]|nr:citramalate synthase [Pseudomonadota bacterium]